MYPDDKYTTLMMRCHLPSCIFVVREFSSQG